jgi:catechol-2,3-dioxygenase
MVQIQDAPCHGPQVRSLRCVRGEGKENLLLSEPIHPQVRIGHTHLQVADLRRATAFYRDVLGFEVMRYGLVDAAFLPAGLPPHRA